MEEGDNFHSPKNSTLLFHVGWMAVALQTEMLDRMLFLKECRIKIVRFTYDISFDKIRENQI